MRAIPSELASRLDLGVTTLAHVWRVQRRDSQVFAFTDHDRALPFGALVADPMTGLVAGAVEKSLDLAVDTTSVSGALSASTITEADLTAGRWDGARVDLYHVDWTDATLRVHLFAGRLGEVRRGALAFEAELRGLQAGLNVAVGRVFSRFCDADLGDARCGVDAEAAAFRSSGVIIEVVTTSSFKASGLSAFAAGWFSNGRIVWVGGSESEVSVHRIESGDALIELIDRPGYAMTLGAAFTIYAGCDKRFATCRAKFANADNFRGFPHMPGNDALQASPAEGERMDGSSRFS